METNLRDKSVSATPVFRVLEPKECEKRLRVLSPEEFEDIVLRPSKNKDFGGISNVPYRIKDAWFFAWGYLGNGPHETAVNVLLHFSGGDHDFARDFCQEFVVEVISKLPNRESVLLSARFVLGWIRDRRGKRSEYPRYRFGMDSGPHRSWEFGSFRDSAKPLFVD